MTGLKLVFISTNLFLFFFFVILLCLSRLYFTNIELISLLLLFVQLPGKPRYRTWFRYSSLTYSNFLHFRYLNVRGRGMFNTTAILISPHTLFL